MDHWHVSRFSEDDDVYVTSDLYDALSYAADELRDLADMEHDGISAHGEAGNYEEAFHCWERSEKYANVQANAENMVRQHDAEPDQRAPLYAGTDQPNDYDESSKLYQSALWVRSQIVEDSPLNIWECSQPMVTVNAGTADEYESCSEYFL